MPNRTFLPGGSGTAADTLSVQQALDALSHSRFFAGIGEPLMIFSARQVRRYLSEPAIRAAAQARVASCVTAIPESSWRTPLAPSSHTSTLRPSRVVRDHPCHPGLTARRPESDL